MKRKTTFKAKAQVNNLIKINIGDKKKKRKNPERREDGLWHQQQQQLQNQQLMFLMMQNAGKGGGRWDKEKTKESIRQSVRDQVRNQLASSQSSGSQRSGPPPGVNHYFIPSDHLHQSSQWVLRNGPGGTATLQQLHTSQGMVPVDHPGASTNNLGHRSLQGSQQQQGGCSPKKTSPFHQV